MAGDRVDFRANANGLVIVFGDNGDFNSIYEQISEKLDAGGYFFHTRYFAATYRGRKLSSTEERLISKMMAEKTGAKTVIFEIDPSYEPPRAKPMADGRVRISTGLTRHIAASPDERLTKYINTSLRQDQSIRYNGDVVIVGDVGAGAKVVATGNVIVLGAVRGAVHAGIAGDESATVVSLAFEPSHLRIAGIDYSERRRGPGPRERLWPEIAYLDGGEITFEPLTERQLSKLTQ